MFSNKCPIVKCFQLNNRLLIPSQSFLLLRSELLLSYQYHHILFDKVQRAPATKGIVRIQVALTIPMSLLGREACSAKVSMLPESHRNGLHNGISPVSFGPSASTAQSMAAVPLLIIVEKRMNLRINSNLQRNPHFVRNLL